MKKVYLGLFGVFALSFSGIAQKNTAKPLNTKKFAPLELKAKPGAIIQSDHEVFYLGIAFKSISNAFKDSDNSRPLSKLVF